MNSETLTIGMIESRNVQRLVGLEIAADPAKRTRWAMRLARTWGAGDRKEWDVGCGLCKGCAQPIDDEPTKATVCDQEISLPSTVCSDCMTLVREHYSAPNEARAEEVTRTPRWDQECPPRFKDALAEKLPESVDVVAFKKVTSWRPGYGKGLALRGPSGSGKTTAYWGLARDLEREGCTPTILTAVQLGRILSEAARDIKEVAWLYNCRVLMIDDLGKEKSTPAMAALFWEVLDKRYGLGLPLIITTRFKGDELRQRFGEQSLGDDITRRLNELCSLVQFNLPAEKAA